MIDNSEYFKGKVISGHLSFELLTLCHFLMRVKVISKSSKLESKSFYCVASA